MRHDARRWLAYAHLLMASGGSAALLASAWIWSRQANDATAIVDAVDRSLLDPTAWLVAMGIALVVLAAEGWAAWAFLRGRAGAAGALRVFGLLHLFNVPLGTALGAWTLWVLRPSAAATPAPAATG